MTSVTGIVKSTANAAIAANSNTPLPAHACTSPRSWGIAPIARYSRPHARNLDVSGTRRRPPHLPLFTCSTPVAYPHHLLAPATTIPPAAIPVIASCTNLRFQLTVTTALLKILAVHKIVLSSPHRDRFSLPFVYHDHISGLSYLRRLSPPFVAVSVLLIFWHPHFLSSICFSVFVPYVKRSPPQPLLHITGT